MIDARPDSSVSGWLFPALPKQPRTGVEISEGLWALGQWSLLHPVEEWARQS
jgi:hypothetical protein